MPTNTYVELDKTTISGTSTNQVTFTSIPSNYTDLRIVINAGETGSGSGGFITFNNDGGVGDLYSFTRILGNGSSAASARASNRNTNTWVLGNGIAVPTTVSNVTTIDIMNYANTTTNKTALVRENNAASGVVASAILWRNTSAINRVDITYTGANFANGSTFSLYGISAIGGVTPKATGGTVTSDATYWYHTFEMSGNFVPNQSLSCDYLVIAGGGSGGGGSGGVGAGGGGAGGFRTSIGGSQLSLTAQRYPVTVGAGGASVNTLATQGISGSNSVFDTITSTGGGGGGYPTSPKGTVGSSGGSGGGSGASGDGTSTAGGSASPSGQGNAGGAGGTGSALPFRGGGGGGAGGVGQAASVSGNGGAGLASSITGTSITYAGGGGGGGNVTAGTGGTGGGGAGAAGAGVNATAGTENTGGGGGATCGGTIPATSGRGGSGIVILRYTKA
jgi:hypothetical protein